MTDYDWDAFISHASEDKDDVARPLANQLAGFGLRVWLDESEIQLGNSLRVKIDAGLVHSRFGIVILSPSTHFSWNVSRDSRSG
ncbi:toll/interleukin-1 receptor domain-containing protein [Bradyrhizobium sp. Mp27]|uniref:toll/interleukin-1 receptor domain-containing protein n=1 Tax=Bradyrhizobium sp. Mp27 TaxID=3042157 RepID=UPI0032B15A7C